MCPARVCGRWELRCLGPGLGPRDARDGGLPSDDGSRARDQPAAWALPPHAGTHHVVAVHTPRGATVVDAASRDADLSTPLLAREPVEAVAAEGRAGDSQSVSIMQPARNSIEEEDLDREATVEETVSFGVFALPQAVCWDFVASCAGVVWWPPLCMLCAHCACCVWL